MHKLKINNSLDVARWEKLECQCDMHNETKCYPFVKCEHCRCQECWDSVPQENFTVTAGAAGTTLVEAQVLPASRDEVPIEVTV